MTVGPEEVPGAEEAPGAGVVPGVGPDTLSGPGSVLPRRVVPGLSQMGVRTEAGSPVSTTSWRQWGRYHHHHYHHRRRRQAAGGAEVATWAVTEEVAS